ncbi:MAG TPA: hypothetical protein VGF95_14490 [Solirubrobacteraceae bacterium]|jgi:hypothetical protein
MADLTFSAPKAVKAASSGEPIVADTAQLAAFGRALRAGAPAVWKAYRVAVRPAAAVVLADAQARASYSSRIPGSGRIRVTAGGNVKVIFGGDAAPDAAPIENRGRGFVRHPVFGNRENWTEKNSHPAFLGPAFAAHQVEAMETIERAVLAAIDAVIGG